MRGHMKPHPKSHSTLNNIIYLFRDVARAYPSLIIIMAVEIVTSVLSPVLGIWLPSLTVRLLSEVTAAGSTASAAAASTTENAAATAAASLPLLLRIGSIGLLLALLLGLQKMCSEGKYSKVNSMRRYYQQKGLSRFLHCDYAQAESQEGQTRYRRAMETLFGGDWSGTSVMQQSTVSLIINALCFTAYSGILTTLHPLIVLLLILLSALNLFLTRLAQKYEQSQRDKQAGLCQKMDYIQWTTRDTLYGKDIRLYGMGSWFLQIQNSLIEAYANLQKQIKNRYFIVSCLNILTLFLRDAAAYGYLIHRVLSGLIGIDEFVLYFGAVTGFAGFIQNISNNFNELHEACLKMNDLRSFLETPDANEPENPVDLPASRRISIDFDHVWFSYQPDSPVLQDFCFHIDAGEKIALVGVNGAGKTTLMKLLCGLYRPDRGTIRINGTDISRFRREDLFTLFSAVFQEIYIPPHSVAENISLQPESETDMERTEQCLKQVGLYETIASHPDGLRTKMSKTLFNGIQLSGGQQQKLLMARALYKEAPVMILDEPTAALDPIAESETYESFRQFSGDRTVIYISHRLASTRFCDRIAFLSGGKITETGTHEELMLRKGSYAEMFEVQSHYYQKGGTFS